MKYSWSIYSKRGNFNNAYVFEPYQRSAELMNKAFTFSMGVDVIFEHLL